MPPELAPVLVQRNCLLTAVFAETSLDARLVSLPQGRRLFTAAADADSVYFPLDSVISLTICFSDGRWAEVVAIGRDGAVGPFDPRGASPSQEVLVSVGGRAAILSLAELRAATLRSERLSALFGEYIRFCFAAGLQQAGCYASHGAEERVATWLCLAHRRVGSEIRTTHEWLAGLLALRRATISLILEQFEQRRLIALRRRRVVIEDLAAIRATACECLTALSQFPAACPSPP